MSVACGPRTLDGNGSESNLIFVFTSSLRSTCALISLLQHLQILRWLFSSELLDAFI